METTRDNSLDAGLLTTEEKQALQAAELPAPTQNPTQRKRKGLSPYLVVAVIVGALLTFGVALGPRMTNCMRHHAAKVDDATFSQLLHSANPESLRQLLHDRLPEKYGKGVFPSEKDAIEAVHEDDAPLATKIIKLAARQDDNNSTSEEPTTTEEETTTTEEPTETTTSDEDDETTTSEEEETTTTSDDSESSPTADPSDDNNDDDQGTSVSDSSSPTGSDEPSSSRSSSPSSPSTSSSSEDQNPSSKEDEKTSSKGTTVTSTDSEGNAVTITSYADAEQPTNDDDDDEEGDPDLQDAGARPAVALLPVLGAVAGAAFML